MSQICTISLFHFEGFNNKWWAFTQMGRRAFLNNTPSVPSRPTFAKMFGAGSGNGFALMPDFGTYGLLTVFNSMDDADAFLNDNPIFKEYLTRSSKVVTVFLNPLLAHGQWGKVEPFISQKPSNANPPIAVMTRGTVKTRFIIDFLRFTRATSRSMENAKGRFYSIGIGEVPITQQATFSIWKDIESMKDYAYKNAHHSEVIKKTRELGWYSEELFARFEVQRLIIWEDKSNLKPINIPLERVESYFTEGIV